MQNLAPEIRPDRKFVLGANLPWLRYGCDFGASAWWPDGGLAARTDAGEVVARLQDLRERGVAVVRWFVLCDGRSGLRVDAHGAPVGLDDAVFRDFDTALAWIEEARLRVLPVLLDFAWCHPRRVVNGVSVGGRRRVLARPALRRRLLDCVVGPLLARYGQEASVLAWDVINEPEWVTFGVGSWNPFTSVRKSAMRNYIRDAAALVHASTIHEVTVGSARARWLPLVRGLGLDLYAPHFYERFESDVPLSTPVSAFGLDRPILLGEFPTSGDARPAGLMLETARQAGYAGALFWSVTAEDEASDFVGAQASLTEWKDAASAARAGPRG